MAAINIQDVVGKGICTNEIRNKYGLRQLFHNPKFCKVSADPKYAPAYYNLGIIYKKMGDEVSMRKQYDKLIALKEAGLANRLIGRSDDGRLPSQVLIKF